MKNVLLTSAIVLQAVMAGAQTKADYDAALTRFQTFYNTSQNDSIYNMLSDEGKKMLPADKVDVTFKGFMSQYGKLSSFEETKAKPGGALYKTTFEHAVFSLGIALTEDHKLSNFRFAPYKKEEASTQPKEPSNFEYKSPTGTIYGSLVMPLNTTGKVPVVLIVAGSGPTDRNCNSELGLTSNAFRMLADSLQKAGIASVRYDKRGVGESGGARIESVANEFGQEVADAAGLLKMLKEDARFSKVFVLGHSEGSLQGMLAAEEQNVAGIISVAGAGETINKIVARQEGAQSEELGARAQTIADSIYNGYTVTEVPAALQNVFNVPMQPYLHAWMQYDPQKEIKKMKAPVLIVQGSTDFQASMGDAEKLHKANKHSTLQIVEGMNHVLKQAPADRMSNMATYDKPDLPLSAGLMPGIVAFINHAN